MTEHKQAPERIWADTSATEINTAEGGGCYVEYVRKDLHCALRARVAELEAHKDAGWDQQRYWCERYEGLTARLHETEAALTEARERLEQVTRERDNYNAMYEGALITFSTDRVRRAAEAIAEIIDKNIIKTGMSEHRIILDGTAHTGPVAQWAYETLTTIRDMLRALAAQTGGEQ